MSGFRIFAVLIVMGLAGCHGALREIADAPTQHLLVSTVSQPLTNGSFVSTIVFPPQGGYRSGIIQEEGGVPQSQRARPITSPGVGANNDIYVAAWWCDPTNFNTLCMAVSEDGERWDVVGSSIGVGTGQLGNRSGPSVTFFPPNRNWFIAFRDDSNGNILLSELIIRCQAAPGGGCQTDGDGVTLYETQLVSGPTAVAVGGAPLITDSRPSASYAGNNLVLAFNAPGTSPMRATVATSPGGNPATFAATVTPAVSHGGAPYVNKSVTDLLLAVGRNEVAGTVIDVFASTDGVGFALDRTLPSVGNPFGDPFDPAISGTAGESLVAFRRSGQTQTTVDISGARIHLPTDTNRPVSLAHGPGPHDWASHSCVEPFLTVIGSNDTITLAANDRGILSTDGDATLICGAFQAPAGCSDNTDQVRVFRTSPGVTVECWN